MSQAYALHVLKVAVAKICQTIGWHSTHTTTIDLLIDVTQHFLREISRIMMRYCELYNRTEPNLNDLALAYRDIGINMQELMEYIQFVDPITLPFAVPRFPIPRESNLNFLKPGSREMVTRPLHIPWYMPPMYPELEEADRVEGSETGVDEEKAVVRVDSDGMDILPLRALNVIEGSDDLSAVGDAEMKLVEGATLTEITIDETGEKLDNAETVPLVEEGALPPEALVNEEVEIPMQTLEIKDSSSSDPVVTSAPTDVGAGEPDTANQKVPEPPLEKEGGQPSLPAPGEATGGKGNAAEGRPTRNISSVIMTTSGFISPAREGKLPDSRIPIIPEERPPRMLQPAPSAVGVSQGMLPVAGAAAAGGAHQAVAAAPSSVSGASVHSLALLPTHALANPRDPKHSNTSSGAGGAQAAGAGTPFAMQAVSSTTSGSKPSGTSEKTNKKEKIKKKPLDRERKKGEKKAAGAAAMLAPKGDKQVSGSEKTTSGGAKPATVGDAATAAGDGKEWTSTVQPLALSAMPPESAGSTQPSVPAAVHFPAVSGASAQPAAGVVLSATSIQSTDVPSVSGKIGKQPKSKLGKEKVLKKRKALQGLSEPGALFPGDIALTTPELFDKLPPAVKPPKIKSSAKRLKQAKKLQALQAGGMLPDGATGSGTGAPQLEPLVGAPGSNQPPPLIDPWRVGALSNDKLGVPNAAAGLLGSPFDIVKPHGSKQKGTGKQQKGETTAEQLSMLQMMHPSLEITASPAPDQPAKQSGSSKKSGGSKAKEARMHTPMLLPSAPSFASDRDVIVIDDDKSPPRTPRMPVPGAPEGKKARKQKDALFPPAAGSFGQEHGPGGGEFVIPPGGAGAALPFRDSYSSPEVQMSAIPKTPDIKLASSSSSSTSLASETGGRTSSKGSTRMCDMFPEVVMEREPAAAAAAATPAAMWTGDRGLISAPTEKRQKRPKQKPPKGSSDQGAKQMKLDPADPDAPFGQGQAAGRNPFSFFTPGVPGLPPYNNYLNQSLGARMPFGMFPFPSGPGLIPDNSLFPMQPGTYPMGPGNFATNPFALAGQINNLLRMPRPLTGGRNALGGGAGGGAGSLNPYQNNPFDDNLDPETKLAQTPLDLQKSNCNVAPLVPPSLFQAGDESLNLSLKLAGSSSSSSANGGGGGKASQPQKKSHSGGPGSANSAATVTATSASAATSSISSQAATPAKELAAREFLDLEPSSKHLESRKEDQVVILPAASVLLGASPPQRSSVCVIDIDDSDGSQSTATTTGGDKSKDGRRKVGKEHKKDRKLKDGKIKKKKDKKDKSRSKEREREQQLKELTAGTATSSAVLTMGMIGAEEALMEQLRKERKEKKEKRKDKLKKEKRKERERMLQGAGEQPAAGASSLAAGAAAESASVGESPAGTAGLPVPKLIMKLGGSATTPSPRSDTPEQYQTAAGTEHKRDGSPELARISALVTRPPKLKLTTGSGSGKSSKKDDSPTKGSAGAALDGGSTEQSSHDATPGKLSLVGSGLAFAGDAGGDVSASGASLGGAPGNKVGSFGGGSCTTVTSGGPAKGGSKAARSVSLGGVEYASSAGGSKASAGDASGSRKAPKDGSSKGSKSSSSSSSVHHHHHHAAPSTLAAPAHMTDADGNTVWICPACGRVDDGTPMIGCDGCDAWYHWVCVGIQVPPDDNEDWYCRVCIGKKQDSHTDSEKQRKRKKKDKKTPKD